MSDKVGKMRKYKTDYDRKLAARIRTARKAGHIVTIQLPDSSGYCSILITSQDGRVLRGGQTDDLCLASEWRREEVSSYYAKLREEAGF